MHQFDKNTKQDYICLNLEGIKMTLTVELTKPRAGKVSGLVAHSKAPTRKPRSVQNRSAQDIKLPSEWIAAERAGVSSAVFQKNIKKLNLSMARALQIFNIPKSTAAHKISSGDKFVGTDALAAIRLEKLLKLAEQMVANSLHPDAKNFDTGKWLGEWIERPQRALGGLKPSELLDTEEGSQYVIRILGAVESGSYQ